MIGKKATDAPKEEVKKPAEGKGEGKAKATEPGKEKPAAPEKKEEP